MIAALIFATVAGSLLAALICKGVKLRLWIDVAAGIGAAVGTWVAAILAGSSAWPLIGLAFGYAAVVAFLRLSK